MRYKVGCTIELEVEVEAQNEQDAIIVAMNKQEDAVRGMRIRKHWWEYVKEADTNGKTDNDRRRNAGPAGMA